MKRRFPKPRTLLMFVLLLVGGTIVNVAVAWGVSRLAPHKDHQISADLTESVIASCHNNAPEAFPSISAEDLSTVTSHVTDGLVYQRSVVGDVYVLFSVLNNFAHRESQYVQVLSGWPMRSMTGAFWDHRSSKKIIASQSRKCIRLSASQFDWGLDKSVPLLPLAPLWPGFAINTLFYAAILWGLFAAPFALRRRRRIRRGWCPRCAYPVGSGPICTECGRPVISR